MANKEALAVEKSQSESRRQLLSHLQKRLLESEGQLSKLQAERRKILASQAEVETALSEQEAAGMGKKSLSELTQALRETELVLSEELESLQTARERRIKASEARSAEESWHEAAKTAHEALEKQLGVLLDKEGKDGLQSILRPKTPWVGAISLLLGGIKWRQGLPDSPLLPGEGVYQDTPTRAETEGGDSHSSLLPLVSFLGVPIPSFLQKGYVPKDLLLPIEVLRGFLREDEWFLWTDGAQYGKDWSFRPALHEEGLMSLREKHDKSAKDVVEKGLRLQAALVEESTCRQLESESELAFSACQVALAEKRSALSVGEDEFRKEEAEKTRLLTKRESLQSRNISLQMDIEEASKARASVEAHLLEVDVSATGEGCAHLEARLASDESAKMKAKSRLQAGQLSYQSALQKTQQAQSALATAKALLQRSGRAMAALSLEDKVAPSGKDLLQRRSLLEAKYQECKGELEALQTQLNTASDALNQLRQREGEHEKQVHALLSEQGMVAAKLAAAAERREMAGEKFESVLSIHGMRDWLAKHEEDLHNPKSFEKEIQRAKSALSALGEVNLAAESSYKTLQEERNSLITETELLQSSIQELKGAIEKMNATEKLQFDSAFQRISERFSLHYATITGGEAKLRINDEGALFITVRPSGKRLMPLHLLSGGEKSMASLVFVLTLAEEGRAPLCVLDEADAVLDESNSIVYIRLLKRYAEQMQLVLVSHNKAVIAELGHLVGITTGTEGGSEVALIDLREFDAQYPLFASSSG